MASVDERRCLIYPLPSANEETDQEANFGKHLHRTCASCLFKTRWPMSGHHPSKPDSVAYLVEEERSCQQSLSSLDNGDPLDDRVIKGITLSFMVIGVNLNKFRSYSPITLSLAEDEVNISATDPLGDWRLLVGQHDSHPYGRGIQGI